jgi:hypothetical protein
MKLSRRRYVGASLFTPDLATARKKRVLDVSEERPKVD